MKKILAFVILVSIFIFATFVIPDAIANDKKKDVILSTANIDKDYKILGLVYYRSGQLDPKKIHDELRKQAKAMGADYVIGITYYSNFDFLYGSGTAIKLIEKDKTKE